MPEWTNSQKAAIEERDADILVSAAAGAGKTAVLVERIIRRITDPDDPVEIDQLLVVTFTNLAAAQMRSRIGEALAATLAKRPSAKTRHQLLLLNLASVNTLHSFCLELVRSHYYRLGMAPGFRVAGEEETALIRRRVIENLLESWYGSGNPEFLGLVDDYGGEKGDDRLVELVQHLYDFSRSHPDPDTWLTEAAAAFGFRQGMTPDELAWTQTLKGAMETALAGAHDRLVQALRLSQRPLGPAVYTPVLEQDLADIMALQGGLARPWPQLQQAFTGFSWPRLPACRKVEDEDCKERVRYLRDKAKAALKDVRDRFFGREPEQILEDHVLLAPRMAALVDLVAAFAAGYREAKLAKGLVDFGDLEHLALRLLKAPDGGPTELAQSLRGRYAEVLVDEYQDINAVQEAILQMVSRPTENLFMVGDVKQSIYRFRLAEPGLFLSKYQRFDSNPGSCERRINLAENFRSRPEVLQAVNFIFRQIMTPLAGEMDYGPEAELVCGRTGLTPGTEPVELHLLRPAEAEDDDEESLSAMEQEARLVAGRIRELLGSQLGDGQPPVKLGDIVVLLRSVRGAADSFVDEFRRQGIPASIAMGSGYWTTTEVETMLSLLQIIDNPLQDIPLAAALRSPVVGLEAADLAAIRKASESDCFYTAVVDAASRLTGDSFTRLERFLARLAEWRVQVTEGHLSEMIWRIYQETGYYDYVGALPGGQVRQANLRALFDRACEYEETGYPSLLDFLGFVENLRENGKEPAIVEENENSVRVMSIHKSKGLEFPVVFIAGLGRSFNLQDARSQTVLHKDLGIGPDVVNRELGIRYPSWAKLAIREKMVRESLAEEMRILYVALTRAREKLILVATVRNLASKTKEWGTYLDWPRVALPDSVLLAATNCMGWIGPAIIRHRDAQVLMPDTDRTPLSVVREDPSCWLVRCPQELPVPGDISSDVADETLLADIRQGKTLSPPPAVTQAVETCLDWVYPYQEAVGLATKIGVTELRGLYGADENTEYRHPAPVPIIRPRFLQETRELSELERGSAWHLVLQHLDLAGDLGTAGVIRQIDEMQARLLLTPQQAAVVAPERIARLFSGDLGQRICRATVRRELPFSLLLPSSEIYPGLRDESVLVQGVIDCLADEGDGLLLVDWKTEHVRSGAAAADRYRMQVNVYARAVESILGRPVKEKYLYFLLANEAVAIA